MGTAGNFRKLDTFAKSTDLVCKMHYQALRKAYFFLWEISNHGSRSIGIFGCNVCRARLRILGRYSSIEGSRARTSDACVSPATRGLESERQHRGSGHGKLLGVAFAVSGTPGECEAAEFARANSADSLSL